MNKIRLYLDTLSLAIDAEKELGATNLTVSDRVLLIEMWNNSDHATGAVTLSYEKFSLSAHADDVSRSQFFKSINKLLEIGIINRVGSVRGSTYQFNL